MRLKTNKIYRNNITNCWNSPSLLTHVCHTTDTLVVTWYFKINIKITKFNQVKKTF